MCLSSVLKIKHFHASLSHQHAGIHLATFLWFYVGGGIIHLYLLTMSIVPLATHKFVIFILKSHFRSRGARACMYVRVYSVYYNDKFNWQVFKLNISTPFAKLGLNILQITN